jgi:LacI family transcriptional regulator
MRKQPRVALLGDSSSAYFRGVMRGIESYVRKHKPWAIFLSEQTADEPPKWLSTWQGDGILARIANERMRHAVTQTCLPTIELSETLPSRSFSSVWTDEESVAQFAAAHLKDRKSNSFSYVGIEQFAWSKRQEVAFCREIEDAELRCERFQIRDSSPGMEMCHGEDEKALADWLLALPKPAGIFACDDFRGWQILEVCRQIGIAVPEEVAVIGVGNDERLCELSTPSLTSIELDTFGIGYEAARLLDEWIVSGHPPHSIRVKPVRIVLRQSTQGLAIADPDIARALRMIRERACEGINVDDILRIVPLSRRVFENRFKTLIGQTPHDYIILVRFEHVTRLLAETDLSIAEVAARTGFCYPEYLCTAFKRRFGIRTEEYRRMCLLGTHSGELLLSSEMGASA